MTSLKIETNDKKENNERDLVLKKYKDYYNTNGFYKVSVDLNELKKYLDSKFGKKTIEKFRNKRVEHFFDVNYGDQTISSDTLNLNFKENIIEILDNFVSKSIICGINLSFTIVLPSLPSIYGSTLNSSTTKKYIPLTVNFVKSLPVSLEIS